MNGNSMHKNNRKLKFCFSELIDKHKNMAGKKKANALKPRGRNICPINPVAKPM